jgi:hypothetical protein
VWGKTSGTALSRLPWQIRQTSRLDFQTEPGPEKHHCATESTTSFISPNSSGHFALAAVSALFIAAKNSDIRLILDGLARPESRQQGLKLAQIALPAIAKVELGCLGWMEVLENSTHLKPICKESFPD